MIKTYLSTFAMVFVLSIGLISSHTYANSYKTQIKEIAAWDNLKLNTQLSDVSDNDVKNWTSETITRAMTLGFHDYQRRFDYISPRFNETAWSKYMEWIKSRHLDDITTLQMVMQTTVTELPTIFRKNADSWILTTPITYSLLRGGADKIEHGASIIIQIQSGSITEDNPLGLQVVNWAISAGN